MLLSAGRDEPANDLFHVYELVFIHHLLLLTVLSNSIALRSQGGMWMGLNILAVLAMVELAITLLVSIIASCWKHLKAKCCRTKVISISLFHYDAG